MIGLVQVGEPAMADRHTCLPQTGFCLLIASSAAWVLATFPDAAKQG